VRIWVNRQGTRAFADRMNAERTAREVLDDLAAQVLAADPAGKEEVVQIGAALEKAITGDSELPAGAREALCTALEALQAIYEGKPPDPSATIDATAAVIAAVARDLCDPEDADAEAVGQRVRQLAGVLEVSEEPAQVAADQAPTARRERSEQRPTTDSPPGQAGEHTHAPASPRAELPADTDMDLLREFAVECLDHVSGAEAALLELESNPGDAEQINTIFRAFHTIKGTSAFLGLDHIQKLAHLAENLLNRARDGEIKVLGGYSDLALNSCDALRTMIEALDGVEPGGALELPGTYEELITQLSDPEAAGIGEEADTEVLRTGDILVGRGQADRAAVEQAAKAQDGHPIGQTLVQVGAASASDVADALRTQKKMRGKTGEATVRVGTERLDGLMDAVGELVVVQSMVAQHPAVTGGEYPQLARNVSHTGKIVRELQDVSMSLRMIPLKATFGKMARLVRDLARKAGKKVRVCHRGRGHRDRPQHGRGAQRSAGSHDAKRR